MIIQFEEPKVIVIKPATPEETMTIESIEVVAITDYPDEEIVRAVVILNGQTKVLILWEGEAYTNIGDWTQAQANQRIIKIILSWPTLM